MCFGVAEDRVNVRCLSCLHRYAHFECAARSVAPWVCDVHSSERSGFMALMRQARPRPAHAASGPLLLVPACFHSCMTRHAVSDTWRVRYACRVGNRSGLADFDMACLLSLTVYTYLYLLILTNTNQYLSSPVKSCYHLGYPGFIRGFSGLFGYNLFDGPDLS